MSFKGASILLQHLSIKIKKDRLGSEATSAVFATPLHQIDIFFQAALFFDAPNHEKQTCANTFSLQIANTIALDLKN